MLWNWADIGAFEYAGLVRRIRRDVDSTPQEGLRGPHTVASFRESTLPSSLFLSGAFMSPDLLHPTSPHPLP
jgi:hypothetical protein